MTEQAAVQKEESMVQRRVTIVVVPVFLSAFLLSSCGGASNDVRVTLDDFKFDSSRTDFKVGVPYHFVVTNKGQVAHEIMLMAPMEMAEGMDMAEMDELALANIEADDLPPGASASFDYTFTEPAAPGELEFACHVEGHYEAGMELPITVTE